MKVQVPLQLTSDTHAVRVNDLMNQFQPAFGQIMSSKNTIKPLR
jgi:hypothetical protein